MPVDDADVQGIVNDWFLCQLTSDTPPTVENLISALSGTYGGQDEALDGLRAKVSGWHFVKEAMTQTSLEILVVAEDLLRYIDGQEVATQ